MDSFVKSEIESEIAVANAKRQIAQNPAAEPVVTILWSESPHLKDGNGGSFVIICLSHMS